MVSVGIISIALGRAFHHLYLDLKLCPKDFVQPHIRLPIRQFWESLEDLETVWYGLSLHMQQNTWFAPFR